MSKLNRERAEILQETKSKLWKDLAFGKMLKLEMENPTHLHARTYVHVQGNNQELWHMS